MLPGFPTSGAVEAVAKMLLTSWTEVTVAGMVGVAVMEVVSCARTGATARKAREAMWYNMVS